MARRRRLPGLRPQLRRRERRRHRRPRGVLARLPYLRDLGVDALWFNPWYPSPMADTGYDVTDYRAIDPSFGTLAQAEQLIAEARALGIRTIVDIVPNHVSDQHAWFRAALAVGARLAGAGALLVPARAGERTASCRRTAGSRSSAARPGRARGRERRARASGTCTCSRPSSPTSTGRIPTSGSSTRTCCASGSTAASPASGSTRRPCSSRIPSWPRRVPTARPASTRSRTATSCTRSTAAGARSPTPIAEPRVLVGEVWLPGPRALRALPAPRRAAHRVQLRLPGVPLGAGRDARVDHVDARGARAGRRPGDLGALEPRRHPAGHALRPRRLVVRVRVEAGGHADRPRARHPARAGRGAAGDGAAGLDVRLPGRGARPARGRGHPARAPPGSDVAPLRRRRPGPRRLPRPAALGRRAAAVRLQPEGADRPWLDQPGDWARSRSRPSPSHDFDARALPRRPRACAGRSRGRATATLALAPAPATRSSPSRAAMRFVCLVNFGPDPVQLPAGASVLIASDAARRRCASAGHHGLAPPGEGSGSVRGHVDPTGSPQWLVKRVRAGNRRPVLTKGSDDEVHPYGQDGRRRLRRACWPRASARSRSQPRAAPRAAKVSISVASLIPGSTKAATQQFNNQVKEFEKANPDINVKSVAVPVDRPDVRGQARRRHAADGLHGAVHRRPHARAERPARRPHASRSRRCRTSRSTTRPSSPRARRRTARSSPCRPRPTRRRCTTTARCSPRPGSTRTSRRRPGPRSQPTPSRSPRRPARPATPRWARTTTPPAGS